MNFSVLNWNIEGSKYYTKTKLNKIIPSLEKSEADILCLQEAQELRENLHSLTALQNFNSVFPEDLRDRNIILSKFPVTANGEITFPALTNIKLERALWADIKINDQTLRIYNCHLEIVGVGPKQRIDQLNIILEAAKEHNGPVIICGDMNTTIPPAGLSRKIVQWFHKIISDNLVSDEMYHHQDERHSFLQTARQAGFNEAIDILKSTWCIMPLRWEIFSLKLDWFLVRNIKTPEVSLGKYVSDHRSILAKF